MNRMLLQFYTTIYMLILLLVDIFSSVGLLSEHYCVYPLEDKTFLLAAYALSSEVAGPKHVDS